MLSPHRRFIDPGNMDGIPGVSRRSAIPLRDTPLPGTKKLLTPRDPRLQELVSNQRIERLEASRTGRILGILALVFAVLVPAFFLLVALLPESHPIWPGAGWFFFIAGLGVHLFAVFSQVLSNGRNLPGSLAIPVLYVSFMVCAVIDHLMH